MVLPIDLGRVIQAVEDEHEKVKAQLSSEGMANSKGFVAFDEGFKTCLNAFKELNESFKQQVKANKAGSN